MSQLVRLADAVPAHALETTTEVPTAAPVAGRMYDVRGLKGNAIVERLIPARTGLQALQRGRITGETDQSHNKDE